jgi:hypothetical protein
MKRIKDVATIKKVDKEHKRKNKNPGTKLLIVNNEEEELLE